MVNLPELSNGLTQDAKAVLQGPTGATVASVDVAVATTPQKKGVGLSGVDSLAAGEGMLFVWPTEQPVSLTTDRMAFGLDILFFDDSGRLSQVIEAPLGEPNSRTYEADARWVLEAPLGWAERAGLRDTTVRLEVRWL